MKLLGLVLCLPTIAAAGELEDMARTVADQIATTPKGVRRVYHESFLSQLSEQKITAILTGLHKNYGSVKSVAIRSRDSAESGKFTFSFKSGVEMAVSLSITKSKPRQVIGLWFGPPTESHKDIEAVLASLKQLRGSVGLQLARLSDEIEILHEINPDEPFAIGSTFKLYIVAALMEEGKSWSEVVRLKAKNKSLPSGSLQKWPDDAPLTIHSLASAMISVSDNTATDQLIDFVGRERIEKQLSLCGNKHAEKNLPFLTTMEMFKIKSDTELASRYASSNVNKRRKMLRKIGRMSGDVSPFPDGTPVEIADIEWFASPADLVRLMDWFRRQDNEAALAILGINRGLDVSEESYPYAGYKGGSEPGVLSMTWLLQRHDGAYFCLTGSWNHDGSDGVDLVKFSGLMQGIINLFAESK